MPTWIYPSVSVEYYHSVTTMALYLQEADVSIRHWNPEFRLEAISDRIIMQGLAKLFSPLSFLMSRGNKIWKKFRRKCSISYFPTIDWDHVTDRFIDPIIWVVDTFSGSLGAIFVTLVCLLIIFVVGVAYWLGLPYYWNTHKGLALFLVLLGNWILVNVVFHYYMAFITPPGHPPNIEEIPHITARCKKCQSAKPPRTHHCSLCHTCILRMDHHCPWLNNCVGHFNHRYFFLFMAYVILGMIFLYVFGASVLFHELWVTEGSNEPQGYRVFNNGSHVLPLEEDNAESSPPPKSWRRAAIITEAILCTGILLALGALTTWHARLITRGETSIENLTNRDDRKRADESSVSFNNPYDYGPRENWRIFLGLSEGRSWLCVIFPSIHPPRGDGISWNFRQHQDIDP